MKLKSVAALTLAFALVSSPLLFSACNNDNTAQNGGSSSSEITSAPETSTPEASPDLDSSSNPPLESTQPSVPVTPPSSSAPSSSPEEKPESETVQYIRCTGNNVNLRAGAGTDYTVLGNAEKGTVYAITGKTGQWYKTYYRGKIAYFHTSYAAVFELKKADSAKVENVISEGYKLLGVPYVYGAVRYHDGNGKLLSGFTAQKFDCSSLVQYVFYKGAKVLLNVNTRTQIKQGKYVSSANLRRGDCMFFTNESRKHLTGIERVGHVAIYLGDNYILHTASDYARIEKITATRWKYYIESRRFL